MVILLIGTDSIVWGCSWASDCSLPIPSDVPKRKTCIWSAFEPHSLSCSCFSRFDNCLCYSSWAKATHIPIFSSQEFLSSPIIYKVGCQMTFKRWRSSCSDQTSCDFLSRAVSELRNQIQGCIFHLLPKALHNQAPGSLTVQLTLLWVIGVSRPFDSALCSLGIKFDF